MKFNDLLNEPSATFRVETEKTGAAAQYEDYDGSTHALLFRRDEVELEEINEEFESWLETAEEEEDDEDLVLCGFHPIDTELQVERLFYYRKSENGRTVYSLDVDGTAVPGTLSEFSSSFDCFEKA